MKRIILLILIIVLISTTVSAMEYSAPNPPNTVEPYLPNESSSFWEDLCYIIQKAFHVLHPSLCDAAETCVTVLVIVILISVLDGFAGSSAKAVQLAGTMAVAVALLTPSNALIKLGIQTVEEMSEYGKLLFPVMTAALSAEGGTITSAGLYTGTVLFNSILTTGITKILIPMLYAYIALSIANAAIDERVIKDLQAFAKWIITWTLKISIYVFTGYLGITGVVSGTADAVAVKAAKLAISGAVPVVGSIISDASETILVSAGIMKNAVGTYGVLVIFAIWVIPFLQIGIQYLLLKAVGTIGGILGCKRTVSLVDSFGVAMGYLVAMIGTVCLLLLISTVCFMKGVH